MNPPGFSLTTTPVRSSYPQGLVDTLSRVLLIKPLGFSGLGAAGAFPWEEGAGREADGSTVGLSLTQATS